MVDNTIDSVTPVLSQRYLDLFYKTYNILAELRPELPGHDDINSPARKIGIYTRFIEFANFRIPLSRFLLSVLQYYQINFSQLSVLGAAKLSHFEIMCPVLGHQPSLGMFHRFYVNFISNGWLSFTRRGPTPCYFSKKFDSLKGWNDHFFWIDASIGHIYVSWYNDVSVRKDPLPPDNLVDFELLEKLNNNRTVIRRYPETFLCLVGLSHMGLLDFVKSADPFKVRTRERKLVEGEVPLITKTADVVDEDVVISEPVPTTAGKSPIALKRLELQSGSQSNESRSAPHATEEFMSSSVTLTPKPDVPEDSGSTQDVNVQTRRVLERVVVVVNSSSEHGLLAELGPLIFMGTMPKLLLPRRMKGRMLMNSFESQTIDSATTQNIYVPEWSVNNDVRVENPVFCRNLLDHITPPGYWAALLNQTDARFLDGFNINSSHHACMVSKLRLRYDHEIMSRKRFQKKFIESSAIIQQRDAKIVALKAKLGIAEKESAEVSGLCKRASDLEAAVATKASKVVTLNVQNAKLLGKFSALELICEELNVKMGEEFVSQQDEAARRFEERVVGLDARIVEVKHDMDTDLYPHMLTAIAGRRWVLGHGVHLAVMKCAQSSECHSALGKVEAYDPDVENKYVATVKDFDNVSFSLLGELEALKDSPLALIMYDLTLEGDHGDVDPPSEFLKLQLVSSHVTLPIYYETGSSIGPGFISGEILLSDAIATLCGRAEKKKMSMPSSVTIGGPSQDNSLAIADYHISTLALNNDVVHVTQPHDDLFDTTAVDKPAEL
ncbi:hypothetical protein Tco_0016462 [Tanacetum coccineum]